MVGLPHTLAARRPSRVGLLLGLAGLALLIYLLHERSLRYGLFMDDYAHFKQLRECDWSIGGLTSACRLELLGGIIDAWWLPECTLRFFRPLSFGLMKLVYTLSDWDPAAMHWASLAWHLMASFLLMLLLRRIGSGPVMAWSMAALYALHPAHVATVQWIAAQSELMVTTFLLAATLCFADFRGWPANGDPAPAAAEGARRWLLALGALFFYVLALGCRENAIAFPFVVAALEPLLRGPRTRGVWWLYAAFAGTAVLYLLTRSHYLGGFALPPRPYVMPPGDPDFVRYIFDKLCYYLLGEFLLAPCVPIGGLPYLREHAVLFYGATAALFVTVVLVLWRTKRRVAAVLAPAWLLGFVAPVLPAFESPHHLYLPGVGWAIAATCVFSAIGGEPIARTRWVAWLRPVSMWVIVIGTGLIFAGLTHLFGLALDTAQEVEDCVIDEVATTSPPLHNGDTLYVANLPLIAHYLQLGVQHRLGLKNLRVVALTWSPRLLKMTSPAELVRVDERTYDLQIVGERYFSGPMGLLVEQSTGRADPLPAGQIVRGHGFSVQRLAGDAEGISALRFVFDHAPVGPAVHLFWGSRTRWAVEITN